MVYEPTPPPSPPSSVHGSRRRASRHTPDKDETADTRDEIVSAVLDVLGDRKDREFSIKELVGILSVDSLQAAKDPVAMVASRLNTYLKESTSPLLKKTARPINSKKIYFSLSAMPSPPLEEVEKANGQMDGEHSHHTRAHARRQGLFRRTPSPELEFERLDGFDTVKGHERVKHFDIGMDEIHRQTTPPPESIARPSLDSPMQQDVEEDSTHEEEHAAIHLPSLDGEEEYASHARYASLPSTEELFELNDWLDIDSPEEMGLDELDGMLNFLP